MKNLNLPKSELEDRLSTVLKKIDSMENTLRDLKRECQYLAVEKELVAVEPCLDCGRRAEHTADCPQVYLIV